MSEKRPKIHIAVACHKPSRIPHNDIFVPVQVNAALAKNRMDNMAHDDEGENISEKNYSYCELTAQYWEWKNVDADYYGLCHYRRFPCFKVPDNIKWNNRAQIVSETIDDWSMKRFGLDDEETMRRIIEANDVVTGLEQDIKGVSTPKGDQPTAWKHWMAQHRVVIMQDDLLTFMRILKEVAPQLGKDAEEYLRGKKFLGFNCFVMKKELFNELCEIEFKILERLEQEIGDVSRYSMPVSRFYGYMGEIISSTFIYQLRKRGAKVLNIPLVYFNHTDPEQRFPRNDKAAIPVLFYHISDRAELFATTWQSFLSHQNPDQRYDAIIFDRGSNKAMCDSFAGMAAGYDNISVRFVAADVFVNGLKERFFSRGMSWKENPGKKIVTVDDEVRFPALPFLLCDLTELDEILVIGDRTLLQTAPDELWNEKLAEGEIAAAPLDPFRLARVEYFYPESDHNEYIKDYANNMHDDMPGHHFTAAMKVDLKEYRKLVQYEKLYESITNPSGFIRDDSEALNFLLSGHFRTVKQNWCTIYECNSYLEYQLPYTPLYVHRELLKARQEPYVITYMLDDPFYPFFTEITERFWKEARKTPFYEMLLDRKTYVFRKEMSKPQQFTRRMLKRGSKLHSAVSFAFPVGSRRYKLMKKILLLFHAE